MKTLTLDHMIARYSRLIDVCMARSGQVMPVTAPPRAG